MTTGNSHERLKPMLATTAAAAFDDPDWSYEVKWDGYRAISILDGKAVTILSRNSKSLDEKFYSIHEALRKLNLNAVLDGEIVVLDDKGRSNFSALQTWRSEADGDLIYYVFDLLALGGEDLMNAPLDKRREKLENLIPGHEYIRISDQFHGTGKDLFRLAGEFGLEGIIAKKSSGAYLPGIRSSDWIKIKTDFRQKVVIGGYTHNENTKRLFSALLVGTFQGDDFVSAGTVGTGFAEKMQEDLVARLKPLVLSSSPFKIAPEFNKPSRFRPNPPPASVIWVKPEIVIEISYKDSSGSALRQASFKRYLPDLNPKTLHEQTAQTARAENSPPPAQTDLVLEKTTQKKPANAKKPPALRPVGATSRKTLLNPKDEVQVRCINDHELKFAHLSKLFWPEDNVTKRDLVNYYYRVVPYILPYITARPQSMNRFPNGIHGMAFYQKDVTGKAPEWIETFAYFSAADDREKHFLVCTDEASLLYMISLGCIEINPWSSRVTSPDNPDWCIIDLDPDKNTFEQVIEAANVVKSILDTMHLPSYCKTSGSTGMHIYIPLGAKYTYEQSKEFARMIAKVVHHQLKDYTSIERAVANRGGKMYIDFLQNRPQATIAGPYSLRPKLGATVSTPLHWSEVKPGLKMKDFTIFNAIERFRSEGDLFAGVLGEGIDMAAALEIAESNWADIIG